MTRETIDLQPLAGLDIELFGSELRFQGVMMTRPPATKRVADLEPVWQDPHAAGVWMEGTAQVPLYTVYWGIYGRQDAARFAAASVEHAYVVLAPGRFGHEYVKTFGHYHAPAHPAGSTYPELYHVLHGHGIFVLQRALPPYTHVDDVVLVHAQAGDVLFVPPNYGHLTVNRGQEPLVFEAFLAADCTAVYEPYRARRGGAVYVAHDEAAGEPAAVPNPAYGDRIAARHALAAAFPAPVALTDGPYYARVAGRPEVCTFLLDPDRE